MRAKKASILFIFITVTLDMIGIGLIIPSLPDIMRRFTSDPVLVSTYFGYFISIYALMQFIASPLLGALSDLYGRRAILLNSILIAALDYILMAFAPTLTVLFIGRVLSGLTGANITVAMAYIADVSDEKNRAANFGLIGAAFGLGFIIGPALGGLLGEVGPQYPFLVAAGMNFLNFLFGLFILPESLPKEMRRKIEIKKLNPLASVMRVFHSKTLFALLTAHFFFQLGGQTHPSIWTLYTEFKFSWTSAQVGASLALVGVLSAFSQAYLTRKLLPKLGEMRAVVIGSLGLAFAYFLFGIATEGWMMYVILGGSCVFWIVGPALQSLVSHKTPSNEQGELQGSLVSLTSLAAILNPLITTHLFAAFSATAPGAPYFFAAFVSLLGFAAVFWRSQEKEALASQ